LAGKKTSHATSIAMFIKNLPKQFHMPISNIALVISFETEIKYRFRAVAILLFYIL